MKILFHSFPFLERISESPVLSITDILESEICAAVISSSLAAQVSAPQEEASSLTNYNTCCSDRHGRNLCIIRKSVAILRDGRLGNSRILEYNEELGPYRTRWEPIQHGQSSSSV